MVLVDGTVFDVDADEMYMILVDASTEGTDCAILIIIQGTRYGKKPLKIKFLSFEDSCFHKY